MTEVGQISAKGVASCPGLPLPHRRPGNEATKCLLCLSWIYYEKVYKQCPTEVVMVVCVAGSLTLSRINLGGANVVAYLNRLLQLSRPPLLPHLTLTRAQELVHTHCYVASEYSMELQDWSTGDRGTLRTYLVDLLTSLSSSLIVLQKSVLISGLQIVMFLLQSENSISVP